MPWRRSLRRRLFVAFALALLPLVAVTIAAYLSTRARLLHAAAAHQAIAAEAVAEQVDTTLDAALAIAWSVASEPRVHTFDEAYLDAHLGNLVVAQSVLDSVRVWDATGVNRGYGHRGRAPPDPRLRIPDRAHFKTVLATNAPVVSYVGALRDPAGADAIVAMVPLRDPAGRAVGTVGAVLLADTFRRRFRQTRLLPGQDLILLDRDGAVVLMTGATRGQAERFVGGLPAAVSALAGNPVEATRVRFAGQERLAAFVPTPRHGWVVGMATATDVALAPARAQLRGQLGTLGAVLAVSLAVSVALARWIAEPIGSLEAAARALAAGDLSRRVTPTTQDELARLAEAFNGMADAIERRDALVRAANEELEGRVRERTAELEAAVGDLESFAFTVSHDLRAPLRGIDGFARLLVEDFGPRLPPEACAHLDRVRAGARQMSRLIDDLLAFARLGRMPLRASEVNVEELVGEVVDALRSEAPRVLVEVRPLPRCHADRAMLRQVFVNLIGNALKYSRPNPAARVTVRGWSEPDGKNVYEVQDNGVGFDMRYADKLFRPFERLHGAEFEGTGVGLAIVDRIVSRHGGTVAAYARADEGATFTVRLPQ